MIVIHKFFGENHDITNIYIHIYLHNKNVLKYAQNVVTNDNSTDMLRKIDTQVRNMLLL